MGNAAYVQGIQCVTARYEVRLKQLIPLGMPLTIYSHISRKTRKVIECTSAVKLPDGTVVAEGNATHFVINVQRTNSKVENNDR